ncbi:MAG: pectin esterase [Bacteroidales bacterium]|nr:pectin esterase [Bacteroidales bacterium]MBN2699225.1 pectin esterase [Bacteroidales bacterium]
MNLRTNLIILLLASVLLFPACSPDRSLADELEKKADMIVASDGTGDFTKVMDAIHAAPDNAPEPVVIFIRNGIYHEKIIVPNQKPNLVFIGEHADSTILTFDDRSHYTRELNTFTSHSVRVDASNITFINLTIQNPARGSQAVALHGNGDRQTFVHCRITGWQDTYYSDMRSRNYFLDCYIEGATDFIFGFGVSLFDSCHIHSLGNYVTAASTPQHYQFGQVFRNCRFDTPPEAEKFTLGRPWFDYARTVLLHCTESEKLVPQGWGAWGGRESTCFYREYQCYGPGSDTTGYGSFRKQLSDEEAAQYTIENIFGAANFPPGDDDYLVYHRKRFVNHKNEPYLEDIVFRADGDWPVKPTENWVPDIASNPLYRLVKQHTLKFIDSAAD